MFKKFQVIDAYNSYSEFQLDSGLRGQIVQRDEPTKNSAAFIDNTFKASGAKGELGFAIITANEAGNWCIQMISVKESYRLRGVARALMDHMRLTGRNIVPSGHPISDAGKALFEAVNPAAAASYKKEKTRTQLQYPPGYVTLTVSAKPVEEKREIERRAIAEVKKT